MLLPVAAGGTPEEGSCRFGTASWRARSLPSPRR